MVPTGVSVLVGDGYGWIGSRLRRAGASGRARITSHLHHCTDPSLDQHPDPVAVAGAVGFSLAHAHRTAVGHGYDQPHRRTYEQPYHHAIRV